MSDEGLWPAALLTAGALIGMLVAMWLGRGSGWRLFQQADAPLSQRVDELTLEVVDLRLSLSRLAVGAARLIAQVERLGEEPEYQLPAQLIRRGADDESDAERLHRLLVEHFNVEELDALAFTAGIPPESYGGHTRPARTLALVQVASRHGKLEELVGQARAERPSVRWPRIKMEV